MRILWDLSGVFLYRFLGCENVECMGFFLVVSVMGRPYVDQEDRG